MTAYLHSARSAGGMSGTSSSVNQACAPGCRPQHKLRVEGLSGIRDQGETPTALELLTSRTHEEHVHGRRSRNGA